MEESNQSSNSLSETWDTSEVQRHTVDSNDHLCAELSPIISRKLSHSGFALTPKLNRPRVESPTLKGEQETENIREELKTPGTNGANYFIPKRPSKKPCIGVKCSKKSWKKLPLESVVVPQLSCPPLNSKENSKKNGDSESTETQNTEGFEKRRVKKRKTASSLKISSLSPIKLSCTSHNLQSEFDSKESTCTTQNTVSPPWKGSISGISPLSHSSPDNVYHFTNSCKATVVSATSEKNKNNDTTPASVFTSTPRNLKADLDWEDFSSVTDTESEGSVMLRPRCQESRFIYSSELQFSSLSQESSNGESASYPKRKRSKLSKWVSQENLSGSDKENLDPNFDGDHSASITNRFWSFLNQKQLQGSFASLCASQPPPLEKNHSNLGVVSLSQPNSTNTWKVLQPNKMIRLEARLDDDYTDEESDRLSFLSKTTSSTNVDSSESKEELKANRDTVTESKSFNQCSTTTTTGELMSTTF